MTKFRELLDGDIVGEIEVVGDRVIKKQKNFSIEKPATYPETYEVYLKRQANQTGNLQSLFERQTGITILDSSD
jgi:hypothetical protein